MRCGHAADASLAPTETPDIVLLLPLTPSAECLGASKRVYAAFDQLGACADAWVTSSTFERRRSRAMPILSMKTKKPMKPMLEIVEITDDAGARYARAILFEIGGANIEDPPTSSTLAACQRPAGARPSCLPSNPRPRLTSASASELRARAAGWSGPASTRGTPASPEARNCGSSGICASRDTG
jgi:hypothetical protein